MLRVVCAVVFCWCMLLVDVLFAGCNVLRVRCWVAARWPSCAVRRLLFDVYDLSSEVCCMLSGVRCVLCVVCCAVCVVCCL